MTQRPAPELLATLKARLVLAAYGEPANPSEVARLLEMPANTVHYWTKRLSEENLLEIVSQEGRVTTYRSLANDDACEPEACVPFVRNAMQALDKVVMAAAEKHDLAERRDPALLPQIGIHELELTPEQVATLLETLKAAMPSTEAGTPTPAQEANPGPAQAYTVSFILAPGRMSDHF